MALGLLGAAVGVGSWTTHAQDPLTNGATHEGAISPAGDKDTWAFTAEVGDTIVLRAGELTETGGTQGFTPALRLYGPNGALLDSDASNANVVEVGARASSGGTYRVEVTDGGAYTNGTGTYRLHLVRLPGAIEVSTADEGGALANGATHAGSIHPGDLDAWTFTATVGDSVVVRAGEVTDGGGTQGFTPALRLYGPNGALVDSDGSNANVVEVGATAGSTGTYTVVVSDGGAYLDGAGTYRLHFVRTPGSLEVSGGDEGGALANGGTHAGTIHAGDLDTWTFTAAVGDSLVLRAGEVTDSGGTQGFTPALRLYGPSGALLDSDTRNLNVVEVGVTATSGGTYVVVVSDGGAYLDAAGTYRLDFARSPGAVEVSAGDEGGPLTNGGTHAGSIQPGDLDVWTLTAQAGDSLVLRAGEVTDNGGTQGFTPSLRLYGPNGALLDSDASNLNVVEVGATATTTGSYTVVVADGGAYLDGAGTYRLHFVRAPAPLEVTAGDEGGALTNGSTHGGAIHAGDLDAWTFTAEAGDSLVLRAGEVTDVGGTQGFTPAVRLYGPNGALLDSDTANVNAVEVAVTAPGAGTYLVVVGDGGAYLDGAGTYRLHLARVPGAFEVSGGDEGGLLVSGATHSGAIHLGDLDVWTFPARAGDSLVLRAGEMADAGGTQGFTPALRLYGPAGTLLAADASNANAVELRATVPADGSCTVVVSDGGGYRDGLGTYRLHLVQMPGSFSVSEGDDGGGLLDGVPVTGAIHLGDLDPWTFLACTGDDVALQVDELAGGAGFLPVLRLYGPEGTLLNTASGPATANIRRTAPRAGAYTLVVSDGSTGNSGTGTYRLAGSGLLAGLRLCRPVRDAAHWVVSGLGGTPGQTFVLLTTTNAVAPVAEWTPIQTNQFDVLGVFTHPEPYDPARPEQYFLLRIP